MTKLQYKPFNWFTLDQYFTIFKDILDLEGHKNHITASIGTAILLNGWMLFIGAASAGEGILSTGPTKSSLCCIHLVCFHSVSLTIH